MRYTENDYRNKCDELGMIFNGTDKHPHKGTMIKFICPIHKQKGMQIVDWSHFRTYTKGCRYCSGRGKTTDDIRSEISDKNVVLISEYTGNEKPINCKCKKCGHIWTTLPKVLVTNKSGCPKCGREKASKNETKSQEDFVDELSVRNPNLIVTGKYITSKTNIQCTCKVCGTVFSATPSNLLNGNTGCPRCNMSRSELMMLQTLDKFGISYKQQFQINDCRFIGTLKFDAFDVNNNIGFEYNGEQHYIPIDFAGRGNDWAKKQLELTQSRDNAKIKYCEENKIPLIIIPYWERNNMESFLLSEFKRRKLYIS